MLCSVLFMSSMSNPDNKFNSIQSFAETNQEIDIYGCLLDKVESRAGCRIERNFVDFMANKTGGKAGFCTDFEPVVLQTMIQATQLEDHFPDHGCVPSCRRNSFNIKEVIHQVMDRALTSTFFKTPALAAKMKCG